MAVWGVEEHEIVLTLAVACRLEERQRRAGGAPRRASPDRGQVAPDGGDRCRRGVHERRPAPPPARAPRSPARRSRRTGRAPARPPSVAEDREQRLADAVARSAASRGPRGATERLRRRTDPAITASLTLGSAPAPRCPKAAPAHRASSACSGRCQLGVLGVDPLGARPRALEQLGVARELGDAELGEAVLARPDSSPSPRSCEVDLGQLETRRVCEASARRRGESLAPNSRHSDACGAAPDPPAQLVQLRDPVAVGVLDQHHGGVRDVDPDLDHRGGDEHVGLARGERRHRLLLLRRAQLPVQQHDPEVAQLAGAQALELGRRRARLQQLGLLDQRADNERLAPGAQLLADPLVGPGALALGGADEASGSAGGRAAARAGR